MAKHQLTRIFGGNRYRLRSTHRLKRKAIHEATRIRRIGALARVVEDEGEWVVYTVP